MFIASRFITSDGLFDGWLSMKAWWEQARARCLRLPAVQQANFSSLVRQQARLQRLRVVHRVRLPHQAMSRVQRLARYQRLPARQWVWLRLLGLQQAHLQRSQVTGQARLPILRRGPYSLMILQPGQNKAMIHPFGQRWRKWPTYD